MKKMITTTRGKMRRRKKKARICMVKILFETICNPMRKRRSRMQVKTH